MKKKSFWKDTVIVGLALFSTMFGAGNLIFPPQIGLFSGQEWFLGAMGLLLGGIVLPVMALWAVNNVGEGSEDLMGHVSPWCYNAFYLVSCTLIAMGSTLPKSAATTYEIGIQPLFPQVPNWAVIIAVSYTHLDVYKRQLQAKLLKVLEEKKVRRLGGSRDIPFDVRIVAAVNEKPQKLIREGRLREDLYYRLGVIRLTLPPLRERLCDIGPLADYFIEHYNRKLHRRVRGLSERALRLLRGYAWPGNVRELKNAIEGAVAVARGERLTVEDMEEILAGRLGGLNRPPELPEALRLEESFSLTRALDSYERELLSRAMQQAGSISQAARLLGLSRQNLKYKLKKFDL